MANNDNFAQDVTDSQLNGNGENGGGDNQQDNNSAEAPGRDDDRYSYFHFCFVDTIFFSVLLLVRKWSTYKLDYML